MEVDKIMFFLLEYCVMRLKLDCVGITRCHMVYHIGRKNFIQHCLVRVLLNIAVGREALCDVYIISQESYCVGTLDSSPF